jgi:hypothetical protein
MTDASPDALAPRRTVSGLKLTDDVGYRVRAAGQGLPEDVPVLTRRLATLTGQEHGEDVAAWEKWWASQPQRQGAGPAQD